MAIFKDWAGKPASPIFIETTEEEKKANLIILLGSKNKIAGGFHSLNMTVYQELQKDLLFVATVNGFS